MGLTLFIKIDNYENLNRTGNYNVSERKFERLSF
jgi:hypothetical protein